MGILEFDEGKLYADMCIPIIIADGIKDLRKLAAKRDKARGHWVWARVKAVYAEAGVRFDWPPVARLLLGL